MIKKAILCAALVVLAAQSASAQTFDDNAAVAAPSMDLSLGSHDDWPVATNKDVDLSPRVYYDW